MDGNDLAGAIEKIEQLARGCMRPDLMPMPPERTGVYTIWNPASKTLETKVAEPDWHKEKLATPTDLAAMIANSDTKQPEEAVFYSEDQLVWVHSLEDRRDRATCKLIPSTQWQWLSAVSGKSMSQQEIIRTLRVLFRGCVVGEGLIGLLRNLKFNDATAGAASLHHGRESMGRQIERSVLGVEAMPEDVSLDVPVFENHTAIVRVVCALEILVAEQRFVLTPYPQELRRGLDAALASVVKTLTDKNQGLAVYRGSPE
jgi:hypothetical protein